MKENKILECAIFVGGPPRSGTTLAAKSGSFFVSRPNKIETMRIVREIAK